MSYLTITGGAPLQGALDASGNKNAVLPMIAASLLTDETVHLENVPAIDDVRTMLRMADALGVHTEWEPARHSLTLNARTLARASLPASLSSEIRAGILLAGPLLHRLGEASMPPPGGDVIGRRRLDAHFSGLEALGAEIATGRKFVFRAPHGLKGRDIFLPEASVTATAQVLLSAVLADGTTVIRNAAAEPHICDLAALLGKMGAAIDGSGTGTLTVRGVSGLGGARHRVISDHTEVGSFLALAAATGGEVTVSGIDPEHYRMTRMVFERLGVQLEFSGDQVTVRAGQGRRIRPDVGGGIPVIDDGPWPQFASDLMSVMIVLATQASGTVLFFEKMYESRMYFVDRLVAMGANAVICDPHRVVITGPARLHGITLSSPDIRAGIALVGAALCAKGDSVIRNLHLIDRGYEKIDERLRALGAHVDRAD